MGNDPNRESSLQEIEKKGQRGQILAACPKNVGCANIAGSNYAQIRGSSETSQDESERDRAAKISEEKGENALKHVGNRIDRRKDRNLAFRRRRGNLPIRQKLLATRFRYVINFFCRAGVATRGSVPV
jgi:hypothetical protein